MLLKPALRPMNTVETIGHIMTAPAPVLLIVGGDSRDVEIITSALDRRFGSDYRILTAGTAAAGLAELKGLARGGEQVALVAASADCAARAAARRHQPLR
jgi:predicted nuclease with TOPRIM domain